MRSFMLLVTLCVSGSAGASPWVLPPGHLATELRFDYETASHEWLNAGGARSFPLDGSLQSTSLTLAGRYGLGPRLEVGLSAQVRRVVYQSDPVLFDPQPPGDPRDALDFHQDTVFDFSRDVAGLGDVRVSGRYQLFGGARVGTVGLTVKVPTGYDAPRGTFAGQATTVEAFGDEKDAVARPDNIGDDVTLGEGQVDITPMLLFGWATPTGTFVRADAGYALRLGGAGDQLVGGARLGQFIAGRVLLFVGADAAIAVEDGDPIGVSVAAIDPELPANDYRESTNLEPRALRFDHDRMQLTGGLIVRATRTAELHSSITRTVWGRNTSQLTTATLGFAVRADLTDGR